MRGDDPKRGTGRTTALILRAIAAAIDHPTVPVRFQDHFRNKPCHAESIERTAAALGLIGVRARFYSSNEISVVSHPPGRVH